MPDIVVYPYGPNKPVRIRWQSDTMPTDQDIEDIYASFAKGEVGKSAVKAPVNTGRMPSPLEGQLGKPPTTGYAPVAPFGPGSTVQDAQGKPVPKQAVTNPNIVRDRPAPKGIGFTAADYPTSKVPVAKKPNVPNQQVPITNPALKQFGQPNVAQQFQKSIDIKTPEGKANAKKAYKDQPSKLTVPTKGKATVQVQGSASGSFTIPGVGPVRWVQRGPGFVADVPGLGTVMAPDPQSLAKKIHAGFVDVSLKAKTPAASPNYAESEQQAQDFYTNQNQNLTAEERASAKARQARATAKDPMRMSLTNPASIIMGAGEHIPGMVATSAGPVLAMLGGATPEEMQFLARRQTVKQADANVAAQMVKYLIPGTMNAQWTADIAKGVVRSLDDLGKGKWETALTEIAGQAGLPAALHGLRYIKPLIGAWKKFRSGEGSLDAFIAATDKMGLDANRKAAVLDAIKSDPNLGFKGFTPEGKPIFSVKSDVGPVEQVAKVDHAAEIAAKKAELDARRAARKAETEGPLRQGQGIKVNGQPAEVVGTQGDTVTIRYQDGQVRKVKKSNLNAKPEPTPEVTTQPVPTEPKPVSEPSVTAPKATKEPLSPLEQEYSTYLDRMDSLAKEHNDVLSKGIQSGDLELRGKLHYPKTQAGESIMLKAKEISSEWESLRLEDSRWRWRLKYGNESNTGSSAGAGARSDIKTQDVQEPRGNPVGEATGNAGTQPARAGDQLHSGNQGAREGNRVTNKGGRAKVVVPENGSGQRISRVARLGKEEADWVDAVNNASTPIVSRITSRGGKRAEQYVVTDGGKEIARINASKVSDATRTQLNIGDIVHSDEFAVHRRVNFKQPTPNTPKPVEAPQKPVQAAETGNVKREFEFKSDPYGLRVEFTNHKSIVNPSWNVPSQIRDMVSIGGERLPNGYTKGENTLIRLMKMSEKDRDAWVQKVKAAQINKSSVGYWSDAEGNVVAGNNAYRNASSKKYWEPINQSAKQFKEKLERFDSSPRWERTPASVQGKDIYLYARDTQGKTRPVAGPFYTHQEAVNARRIVDERIRKEFDTTRLEGYSYATPESAPMVLYPDVKSAGVSPFKKLEAVNSEIEAVKARRDARLKSTTTKGTKQRGSADFTKDDFNDALELAELYVKKAGYTFEQYAKEMVDYFGDGVKPHLKEIWDTHAPVKAVPKVSAPKVEPNGEDVTGVAKQVTGRDPMKGTSKEEMADRGRQIIEKDINAVANAIDAVEKKGVPMTPDEVSAAGYRLRQIENKQSEIRAAIEKTNDSAELANLNNLQQGLELEVERILKATDYSLNVGFHQYGMAAQIAYKPDFSLAALKSRAKGALLGTVEVVPKHIETKLASYASTIDQLRADLEAARKQIGDLIHKGSYKRGTKESNVKRLRQFFGEDGGAYQPMGSKSSKQRGAIYTLPNEERDAMAAMRSLAKQLADEGAGSLDEIVSGIRKEIGKNIPEETIYRMLSDKYRKYLLESDVQRMDANRYLRDIQRAAEFKLRTPLEKAVEATSDILGATARSLQAGWDISAPFIQGRKGLIANPVGWMKSWESQLKALKTGDAVVSERLAEMERHPLYPRFVAAGGDKLMRRPGGVFHAQEEVFGTNFMRLASDTMSNAGPIGKYNPVNLYLKGLEHSDAAFSAFMNDLTWDTFVKFAKANPSDPAFLRDTVANLGIIYGRGTGPVAEAIGRSKMGNYFYAPRYTLSQMQYAGTPIRVMNPGSYETTAGRMQALRTYGTQAVAYGTLVAIAKLNGWDIETDLRSSDFGTVALPGGRRLDIFGKESQAYRLVANIFAGRVTKKNEYEKPGIVTAWKSVGQFVFGKLAPGPRLPSDVLFGSFDPDKGATPFTMAEFGKRYLPLWVQQTLQNGDMATIPMAILGQDVSKDQKAKLIPEQRSKSHPMELPKIKGKPDPLGRPYDPKAQVNDGDVIKEVQRLGIELKWPDTAEGETEAEYKTRAQKQGDAVRDAIRSQMATSLYKNATITEKREMVKSEISATKRTFNKDFNEAEKTRKADERLKQIERELATGRK